MNTIYELQTLVGEVNRANGWHEGTVTPVERLALITCEVSEAIEEVRDGHCVDEIYYNGTKPEGVPVEIMQGTDALWYMMKTMEAMSPVDIVITIGKLKPPPVDYDAQYNMTIIPNEILDSLWKKIDVWMKTGAADDAKN